MTTARRVQIALAAMLSVLAVLAIAACRHAASTTPTSYTPAGDTVSVEQPTPTIDASSAVNTVDPPAAHDSDIPTGAPATTTRQAPVSIEPTEVPLATITENGTEIVPKPATVNPPAPATATTPPSITEDPCSTPAGCQK